MRYLAVPRKNDLWKGVGTGSIGFDFDGYQRKEEDLPCAHGSVPHRSANAIAIGECR